MPSGRNGYSQVDTNYGANTQSSRHSKPRAMVIAFAATMMLLVGGGYAAAGRADAVAAPPSPPPIAFPGAEWAEVSPERAGLDEAKLVSGLAALSAHGDVGRVMVTRWGSHVALPSAPASHNLSEPAPVWSVSKSLVALSAALLLQNGSLSLDDP